MPDLTLNILPQADADLEDIWLYTAQTWSIVQADHYIIALHKSFMLLCDIPTIARERPEIAPPVRVYPSGRHYVIYRVAGETLTVLRVIHNRRNWQPLLEET